MFKWLRYLNPLVWFGLRVHACGVNKEKGVPRWRSGQAALYRKGRSQRVGRWWWNCFHNARLWSVNFAWKEVGFYAGWFGFHVSFRNEDLDDFEGPPQFKVAVHDGIVWLTFPWTRRDGWDSRDPWWRQKITLHVVDWFLGRRVCKQWCDKRKEWLLFNSKNFPFDERHTGEWTLIPMPEGCYRAKVTREKMLWHRRFGLFKIRRDRVEVSIPGGIPHSGKGENSWDCGDDALMGTGGDTLEDAVANAVKHSLVNRARYGYDSKQTGKTPAAILNHECPHCKKFHARSVPTDKVVPDAFWCPDWKVKVFV